MDPIRVLYDGRPIAEAPLGPQAVHLFHILESLPGEVEPLLALPASPPDWLPPAVTVLRSDTPAVRWPSLAWEQRILPALAREHGAGLLHLAGSAAPLLGRAPAILSGAGYLSEVPPVGLAGRLASAMGMGGAVRSKGMIWPENVAKGRTEARKIPCPFRLPADFKAREFFYPPEIAEIPDLPATFILYHGPPDEVTLRRALDAWTWAAGPIGEVYPLALLGIGREKWPWIQETIARLGLEETVLLLPEVPPTVLPILYRAASAVFHPAEASPWAGAHQMGIACGKPVVGLELPLAGSVVGNAAYLVQPGDARQLGAALIAVIVKENLSRQLHNAAVERSVGWGEASIGSALAQVYGLALNQ